MDDSNPRKRPRPVVSCLRCRDKKLKCDRTSPCENCVKAQIADTCTYQRSVGASSTRSPPVPTGTASAVEDLQSRLAKVEELLGIKSSKPARAEEDAKPQAIGIVELKGSRSIFRGQNDRTTLLNQFLDVKDCLNEISRDKQVQASSGEIKFLQDKFRSKIGSPDSNVGLNFSVALLKLREFLPPKSYCDRLVALYFQHYERTFRVLHIPTFLQRYGKLWTNEHPDICTSSSIIPEVTAVMTMAYHMDDTQQLSDDRNHRTYLKGSAMDLTQAWLNELDRKQRTELSTLQVEVLLLLSRSLRGLQPEQLWSSTGALVRSAMIMGLNVDPASVSGLTPYMAEMRRRLWATILEVDLQASLFCGMPLVIPDLNSSALMPSNINDAEIDDVMATLPIPHPRHTYTDSLFQVALASSLPQRINALSIIQQSTPNIQEGTSLGRKIENFLSEMPRVLSLNKLSEAPADGGSLWHRILLDLYLRRPILRLYKTLLLAHQKSACDTTLRAELEKHCLESSQVILSYQDLYTLPALATITNSPWAHQNLFYNACKADILWAALTLCQEIKQCSGLDKPKSGHDSLVRSVETTIGYLIDRIGQKGCDAKDIVLLALVLQSVQTAESVPGRAEALQQTARKTLALCREKLLQPLVTNEQRSTTAPPAKRLSIDAMPKSASMSNGVTPPISNTQPTPNLMSDLTFPMNLPVSAEQWLSDLPDLAVEYSAFQAGSFNPNDPLNFGIAQNWNWEHMWQ